MIINKAGRRKEDRRISFFFDDYMMLINQLSTSITLSIINRQQHRNAISKRQIGIRCRTFSHLTVMITTTVAINKHHFFSVIHGLFYLQFAQSWNFWEMHIYAYMSYVYHSMCPPSHVPSRCAGYYV